MNRTVTIKHSLLAVSVLAVGTSLAQVSGTLDKFMQAMDASMKTMDRDMAAVPMTGEVDRDFSAMMIPHHKGAIEMAKAELSYGKDPVMRRLAQEIIIDQQSEIDAMKLWEDKKAHATEKRK